MSVFWTMKRKRCYENDHDRIDGILTNNCVTYTNNLLALNDIRSIKDMKRACKQRGIDYSSFLYKEDFIRALLQSKREEECSLCLEQFAKHDKLTVLLCGHEFHTDCLHKSVHTEFENTRSMPRCPLCRKNIR